MNLLIELLKGDSPLEDLRQQAAEAQRAHADAQAAVDRAERALESDSSIGALDQVVAKTARRVRMAAHALAAGEAKAAEQRKRELIKQRDELSRKRRALVTKAKGPALDKATAALTALLAAQTERAALRNELFAISTELKACILELGGESVDEECRALDDNPSADLIRAVSRFRDELKAPTDGPERRAFEELTNFLYRATH